jgi:hypothetical protein
MLINNEADTVLLLYCNWIVSPFSLELNDAVFIIPEKNRSFCLIKSGVNCPNN